MKSFNTNRAFPVSNDANSDGMSLMDYFAGQFAGTLLNIYFKENIDNTNIFFLETDTGDRIGELAYELAASLIRAKDKDYC